MPGRDLLGAVHGGVRRDGAATMKHLEIRRVARRIRRTCERVAPLLGYVDDSLLLFCPFAATAATAALVEAGFSAHLVAGLCCATGHYWTEIVEGPLRRRVVLVDVTSTQFWAGPRVLVIEPGDPKWRRYRAEAADNSALRGMLHEDADLYRILPAKWWECEDRELLDARLVTKLWDEGVDTGAMDDVAAELGVTTREVWEAMGRLAKRVPVHGHARRKAA